MELEGWDTQHDFSADLEESDGYMDRTYTEMTEWKTKKGRTWGNKKTEHDNCNNSLALTRWKTEAGAILSEKEILGVPTDPISHLSICIDADTIRKETLFINVVRIDIRQYGSWVYEMSWHENMGNSP